MAKFLGLILQHIETIFTLLAFFRIQLHKFKWYSSSHLFHDSPREVHFPCSLFCPTFRNLFRPRQLVPEKGRDIFLKALAQKGQLPSVLCSCRSFPSPNIFSTLPFDLKPKGPKRNKRAERHRQPQNGNCLARGSVLWGGGDCSFESYFSLNCLHGLIGVLKTKPRTGRNSFGDSVLGKEIRISPSFYYDNNLKVRFSQLNAAKVRYASSVMEKNEK